MPFVALQMPLEKLGVKFGSGKQSFPIIKHMNGVLRPVRPTLPRIATGSSHTAHAALQC